MDPRLDAKWNGSSDPRVALPLDPWTRAGLRAKRRKDAIPFSLPASLSMIVCLALATGTALWLGINEVAWCFGIVALVSIVTTLWQWFIQPIHDID